MSNQHSSPTQEEIDAFVTGAGSREEAAALDFLKKYPAAINHKEKRHNWTALILSAWGDRKEMAVFLLKNGADIEAKDKFGRTALVYAATSGLTGMVDLLLNNGAAVDAIDENGETALMLAAAVGHKEMVEFLLEKGADLNKKNNDGKTILTILSQLSKKSEITKLLEQWPEKLKQRELAADIADFSPALKRAIPAPRPFRNKL